MKDLADLVQRQVQSKEVDLDAPFLVELSGTIGKNGKLDPVTAKYIRTEGDAKIVEVAKRAVEAMNDAGYFQYLSSFSAGKIVILVKQDETEFAVDISSELSSEQRAKAVVSAMRIMLTFAKDQKSQSPEDQRSKDELILLNSTTVSSESKNFAITFKLPKAVFQIMLARELATPPSKQQSQ